MQRKATRMIRKVIYRLKRDYGFPITLCKIVTNDLNLETGKKEQLGIFLEIKKAILLPTRLFRSFVYDLSYIATAKNFTSGGFFDPNDRVILIDWQDTCDFEIKVDDYIIYEEGKYLITEIRIFEYNTAYLLKVREIKGSEVIHPIYFSLISSWHF